MDKQHTAIRTAGNTFVASGIIQLIAAAVCMFYFFGNYSITLGCNLYDIIDDSLGEEIESLEYNGAKLNTLDARQRENTVVRSFTCHE